MPEAGPNKEGTRYLNEQGQVAALISPDYGAGWSTWNSDLPGEELLFDPGLVELVLKNTPHKQLQAYAETRWSKWHAKGELYCGGLSKIQVVWMTPGQVFRVKEYDGNESIKYLPSENDVFRA